MNNIHKNRSHTISNFSNIFLLSLTLSGASFADTEMPNYKEKEKLIFDGYYRGRVDIYNGVNKVAYGDAAIDAKGNIRGVSNDVIYLHQISAGFTYTPNDEWEIKAYIYDARSWFSDLQPEDFIKNAGTKDEYLASYYDEHLDVHEAYVQKSKFLLDNLTFTLGRQQLQYGDSRIFAPGVWGNTIGYLWDAAHFSYKQDKNFLDAWYGQTRTIDPYEFSLTNKHLYQGVGVYSHYEKSAFKIEPFFAYKDLLYDTTAPGELSYHYGARTYDSSVGFIYDATYTKTVGISGKNAIDAYAYVAKIGYQFDTPYKTQFTIGKLYASGDSDSNDNVKQTYSSPFGSMTGPNYGRMDIMIWSNMKDYQSMLSFNPTKDLFIKAAFHRFELADANDKWYTFGYANKPGNSYTHIGDEYDLTMKYKASKNLDLTAIATYLNAGDFITKNEIAQNDATKFFLQFKYKFSTKE
ncbi:MAG: alginate export family protein [Pseudomonadota bacterium]